MPYPLAFWRFGEHETIVLVFRVIAANFLPDFSAQLYHVFVSMTYRTDLYFFPYPHAETCCRTIYCMHLFCIRKIFVFAHKLQKICLLLKGKTLSIPFYSFCRKPFEKMHFTVLKFFSYTSSNTN